MFNLLKKKNVPNFETLYCLNINNFIDKSTDTEKNVIDEISQWLKSMSYEEFIDSLIKNVSKKESALKVINSEIESGINQVQLEGSLSGYFIYPKSYLNKEHLQTFRLADEDGKKYLQIFNIYPEQNKYPCEKSTMEMFVQYVDLDKDEHELLKPLHDRMKNLKDPKLEKYIEAMHKAIFEELLLTEKRKAKPINFFEPYTCFQK